MDGIADLTMLRHHFGEMSELVKRKLLRRLDAHCRAFIALSPYLVLATCDGEGRVDASPRGDAPGFVVVVDDVTLLLPDRPGNRRVDSFSNVLQSAGVGLIFLVPGVNETLRVNGRAEIITEPTLLGGLAAQGKVPTTGLRIAVEEAFFHCGKAAIRSKLWDPSRHVPRGTFSLGRAVAEQTGVMAVAEAEESIATAYRDRLY